MGSWDDLKKVLEESTKSNRDLGEKMSLIAPELKSSADELVDATGRLNNVGASVWGAIKGHDMQEVGKNWEEASKGWDDEVEAIIKQRVIEEKGYPTDRPLSKEEEEALRKDVKQAKDDFDAQMRGKIGENMFEFGSAIKNGGYEATQAIDQYIRIRDIYKTPTSLKDLSDLSNKIQKTVETTIDATEKLASAGQRVFKWLMHNSKHEHAQSAILNSLEHIGSSYVGIGLTAIAGTAVGINSMVAAFKTGGITGAVSAGKDAYTSVRQQWDKSMTLRDKVLKDNKKLSEEAKEGRHPFFLETPPPPPEDDEDKKIGGAEYVSEVTVVLDGKKAEGNSECVVGETEYLLSNFQLTQSMLNPMRLSFSMLKKNVAEEDEKDVKYDVCKQIIGLDFEITVKTNYSDNPETPAGMFSFKGLITGVSATRGNGGTPMIFVTASSYDYLLNGAANCRSFENKTLEEIVTAVTSPIKNLKCKISPRLKIAIPYIVQFNQTDYDFLAALARRFGEWMYHDGTNFIFGEIVAPSEEVVKMRYPSGNVFSHGVDLQLRDMNLFHIAPDLYKYKEEEGIIKQSDKGMAERDTHVLNDAAFERVKSLYTQTSIYYPHVGGAFDNGKDEGSKDLMLNSIKVESRGKRAQMLICNGSSKVAKLFLGQQFQIEDGVENLSTDKGEVDQHPLMVLSVTHSFELDQSYENVFEALPPSCDYPPYGNADIFTISYPQRATVVDNQDPKGLGRMRVQFPWQKVQETEEEKMWTPWIRIAQSYGGFSKGAQFISEVGEEVMVGFEMGNVERPFVIGAVFNGTENPDPNWMAMVVSGTANNIKAIRTRNGHTLQFCDEGDGGDIQIYDYEKNNYLIHLSTDGKFIRIEAKGDIQLEAGNDISLKAAKNIKVQAGENISVESGKDMDISSDANMSVSAQDNMQQQATDIYVKASDSLSEESGNSHIIKTKTLQEKASGKASIDGGGLLEITAGSVKVR